MNFIAMKVLPNFRAGGSGLYQKFGPMLNLKNSLKHFAHPSS